MEREEKDKLEKRLSAISAAAPVMYEYLKQLEENVKARQDMIDRTRKIIDGIIEHVDWLKEHVLAKG